MNHTFFFRERNLLFLKSTRVRKEKKFANRFGWENGNSEVEVQEGLCVLWKQQRKQRLLQRCRRWSSSRAGSLCLNLNESIENFKWIFILFFLLFLFRVTDNEEIESCLWRRKHWSHGLGLTSCSWRWRTCTRVCSNLWSIHFYFVSFTARHCCVICFPFFFAFMG